jgi:hypothetical protein
MGFKGNSALKVFTSLDPVCPKCGPYEASEGIYPPRHRKNWGRAFVNIFLKRNLRSANVAYHLTARLKDFRGFTFIVFPA